ncbi:Uncharacterized protein TCM_010121 [Theobroma cacao]|uniref:Uncharacterized protein n=1 Tax=Theobroma cacao TaxID=3641 RepID=A0A061E6N3_THECC|nr:Uncharacterized protein TCM_010121 [Theobroma cacao]
MENGRVDPIETRSEGGGAGRRWVDGETDFTRSLWVTCALLSRGKRSMTGLTDCQVRIVEAENEWLKRSVVGKPKVGLSPKMIQKPLKLDGAWVRVRTMGGGLVVVSFDDDEDMQCLLSLNKEIFSLWFEDIRPYYEWLEERRLLVWVKLEDIPFFLWQKAFFEVIDNSWGRLVKVDEDTEEKRRFTCVMILVEVSCKSKITPIVRVEAEGAKYWIKAQIIGATGTFSADIGLGNVKGIDAQCGFINIFAPNDEGKRRDLWVELSEQMNNMEVWWILGGDFNTVRFKEERIGTGDVGRSVGHFDERRTNYIDKVKVNGGFIEKLDGVKTIIAAHFEKLYKSKGVLEVADLNYGLRQISQRAAEEMIRLVIEDEVIENVVGNNQFTFVKGRQLIDAVLIANELIDLIRKEGTGGMIMKVDFEKAYDCIDWGFLDFIMAKIGFLEKWRRWINECISIARFCLLKIAEGKGLCRGIQVGRNKLTVSHLQFADDTMIFYYPNFEEMKNIKRVLKIFQSMPGLKINFAKCSLMGIDMDPKIVEEWANAIECRYNDLSNTYLGLHIGANQRSKQVWRPVIQKVQNRLASWHSKLLSMGERITMMRFNGDSSGVGVRIQPYFVFVLGNGENIRFWSDEWIEDICRKEHFPRIHALANNKCSTVKEFGTWDNRIWEWRVKLRRQVFGWEQEQYESFNDTIKEFFLCKNMKDELVWKKTASETLVWQLMHGKVAVKGELIKREIINAAETLCPLCNDSIETVDHLFVGCINVKSLWYAWCKEWGFAWVMPARFKELMTMWNAIYVKAGSDKIWRMAVFAITWTIWIGRNEVIFHNKVWDKELIWELIKLKVAMWANARWNEKKEILIKFSKAIGRGDSNLAEYLGIREAFILFSNSIWANNYYLVIESDSRNAIKWINDPRKTPWRLRKWMLHIEVLKKRVKGWKARHTLREGNRKADQLANEGVGGLRPCALLFLGLCPAV